MKILFRFLECYALLFGGLLRNDGMDDKIQIIGSGLIIGAVSLLIFT